MKTAWKTVTKLVILGALAATPLFAQIPNGLKFTTSFPFYVGDKYMPAGSYLITQQENTRALLVRGADESNLTDAAFIQSVPTETSTPVNHSLVTFHEYSDVAFLASLTVRGDTDGLEVRPSKREEQAALSTRAQALNISVPLETGRAGD